MKRYIVAAVRNLLEEPWEVQRRAAEDPNTPSRVLAQLANSSSNEVLVTLAQNPNTPKEVLRDFALGGKIFLQRALAHSFSTPSDILDLLVQVNDPYVWEWLAQNPNTSAETFEKLYFNQPEDVSYQYVTQYIAENPNTPAGILETIALNCDKNWARRLACSIAANHGASDTAIRLIYDRFNDTPSVMEELALNPRLPQDLVVEFASSDNWFIRNAIATREDTSAELLKQLLHDEVFDVVETAVKNPNTPSEDIEKLLQNPDYAEVFTPKSVRRALQKRGLKPPAEAQE